jgi:DNA-binding transcriptional LysR family regulator
LASFRRQYPGIHVELVISNQFCDLHAREADIAVRLARPTQVGLITRKVADFRFALYASTGYVDTHGIPRAADDLRRHHGIGLMGGTPTALWLREIFGDTRIVFWSNTLLALRGAVRAGIGIGPVFCFLGDQDAGLVPILPASAFVNKEVWLTCTEEMRGNARIRAVYDFLGNLMSENRHILAGTQPSPDAPMVL